MIKKYYYEEDNFKLIQGDSLKVLRNIEPNSVDMVFADPPYFLSNNGISCSNGKMVSVNKGPWDKAISIKEKHEFNKKWIRLCKKILKENGTIWISGTMHNIYSIGMALEEEGFKIINNIKTFAYSISYRSILLYNFNTNSFNIRIIIMICFL